jgi:hypothetical protein
MKFLIVIAVVVVAVSASSLEVRSERDIAELTRQKKLFISEFFDLFKGIYPGRYM